MNDGPIPPVTPGGTPLRELARIVYAVLALPGPLSNADELTYLQNRVRLVRQAMKDIRDDLDIHRDPLSVIAVVANLRRQALAVNPEDLTIRGLAARAGVDRSTVIGWTQTGVLSCTSNRNGERRLVEAEVRALLASLLKKESR